MAGTRILTDEEKSLEYLMNTLRLYQPIAREHYEANDPVQLATTARTINSAFSSRLANHDRSVTDSNQNGRLFVDEILTWLLPD